MLRNTTIPGPCVINRMGGATLSTQQTRMKVELLLVFNKLG